MTIFNGIILYIMIFWLALFAVLPFGNRASDNVDEGHAAGAPERPRIKEKFLATAVVAAIIWLIVFACVYFDVIDFYDIARRMREEDLAQ